MVRGRSWAIIIGADGATDMQAPLAASPIRARRHECRKHMGLPRSLTAVAQPVTRRALGKKRTVLGSLLAAWSDVAGPEIARLAVPDRLTLSGGGRDSGVLVLRVASADALSISYALPDLRQRINTHYGYQAVAKITLKQTPIGSRAPARDPWGSTLSPPSRERGAGDLAEPELSTMLTDVDDPDIRQALERFGRALHARETDGNR